MATLTAPAARTHSIDGFQDYQVIATDIIYEGAATGDNGSGYSRPLVAGDPFLGFAFETVDNSAGVAGAKRVKTRTEGMVELAVVGATGVADIGELVYASDDDTFTLTSTSNSRIGRIIDHVSGTTCLVAYKAATLLD